MAAPGWVYFTDENTLGLGKLLRRSGRADVLYPGHEDLPDVPVGTPDLQGMPILARLDLVLVTRDRRIRTRPAELRAYWEFGIRSVWIGAGRTLGLETSWTCSSRTRIGCNGRSSNAAPGRGHSQ